MWSLLKEFLKFPAREKMVAHSPHRRAAAAGAILILTAIPASLGRFTRFFDSCRATRHPRCLGVLSRRRCAIVVDGKTFPQHKKNVSRAKKTIRTSRVTPAKFCLRQANLTLVQLDAVVFTTTILKFARLLETYLAVAPGGWRRFRRCCPTGSARSLICARVIRAELPNCGPLPDSFHRTSSITRASAFYPSPFAEAAIVTIAASVNGRPRPLATLRK